MYEKPNKIVDFLKDEAMVTIVSASFLEFIKEESWTALTNGKDVKSYAEASVLFKKFIKHYQDDYKITINNKKKIATLAE